MRAPGLCPVAPQYAEALPEAPAALISIYFDRCLDARPPADASTLGRQKAVQSPLAVMVEDLKAEVDTLKAEVYGLKEELKQVQTRVARDDDIETLQNEVRALKEQVSGQPSQSSSVWQGSSWQGLSWQS